MGIRAIVALIRLSTGGAQTRSIPQLPAYPESPEQVLAARFARGDIDEADYQQRLAVLRATTRR